MNKDYYFYEKIKEEYDKLDTLIGSITIDSQSFSRSNLSESEDYIKDLKEKLNLNLGLQLIPYLEDKQDEDLRIVFRESNKYNRESDITTFSKEIIIYKKKPETETNTDKDKRTELNWLSINNENVCPNKIKR